MRRTPLRGWVQFGWSYAGSRPRLTARRGYAATSLDTSSFERWKSHPVKEGWHPPHVCQHQANVGHPKSAEGPQATDTCKLPERCKQISEWLRYWSDLQISGRCGLLASVLQMLFWTSMLRCCRAVSGTARSVITPCPTFSTCDCAGT